MEKYINIVKPYIFMSLTSKLAQVARSAGRSSARYVGGLAVAAASLAYSGSARGETINMDPSWTMSEINNQLDSSTLTLGKNEIPPGYVLQPGDRAHFAAGTYLLPQDGPGIENYFKTDISGAFLQPVIIEGEGSDNTKFKGYDSEHVRVWMITGKHILFRDLSTDNSMVGTSIRGDYENINFLRIKTRNHGSQHLEYDFKDDSTTTNRASVLLDSCILEGSSNQTGLHFSKGNGLIGLRTKYAGIRSSTIIGLALATDAPFYIDEGGNIIVKGNDDFQDNVTINTASFYEPLYLGFQTPQGYVEAETTTDSLAIRGIQPTHGPLNIETTVSGLMIDANGKPLPGSPLISLKYPRGYAGALPPYTGFVPMDSDGDGDVDMDDFGRFQRCYSGMGAVDDRNCLGADFNKDGHVDTLDFGAFKDCSTRSNVHVQANCYSAPQ